jgi:iron complex outermembrane receptor protein
MKFHSLALSAAVATLLWSGHATAQVVASTPVSKELEEIIVTAERRSESLQTTGIAASVLTGRNWRPAASASSISCSSLRRRDGQQLREGRRIAHGGAKLADHDRRPRDAVPCSGYYRSHDIARANPAGAGTFCRPNDRRRCVHHLGGRSSAATRAISSQVASYNDFGLQGAQPADQRYAGRAHRGQWKRDNFYDIHGPWTGGDGSLDSGSSLGLL